jgi:hypothetical protein
LISFFLAGVQIDIQAAILYDSNTGQQSAFKYMYFVRSNLKVDDQNDEFSGQNITSACNPNPCLNGGACMLGFNLNFVCYCPNGYSGNYLFFVTKI